MMLNTINRLKGLGVSLTLVEGIIKVHIPEMTDREYPVEVNTLLAELKAHKEEAIQLLSQQKKAWVEPELTLLADSNSFMVLWSDMLDDFYMYCLDEQLAGQLRMKGYPVYSNESVLTMILSGDGGYNSEYLRDLHRRFKAMAQKYKKSTNRGVN